MLNKNVSVRFFLVEENANGDVQQTDLGTDEVIARGRFANRVERYIRAGYVAAQYPGAPVYEMTERRTGRVFTVALYDMDDNGEYGGETAPIEGLDWREMGCDCGSGKLSYWN